MLNSYVKNWRKKYMKNRISVIREIDRAKAKQEISALLNKINNKIYPSEIAEQLHIDYNLCVEIIDELLEEEKIEIVEK